MTRIAQESGPWHDFKEYIEVIRAVSSSEEFQEVLQLFLTCPASDANFPSQKELAEGQNGRSKNRKERTKDIMTRVNVFASHKVVIALR